MFNLFNNTIISSNDIGEIDISNRPNNISLISSFKKMIIFFSFYDR